MTDSEAAAWTRGHAVGERELKAAEKRWQVERAELKAEVERLRAVISNAAHKLEQQRVWGGMDWVYPAMHPRVWRAVLEQLDAALKEPK
jgi:hypothetical protein